MSNQIDEAISEHFFNYHEDFNQNNKNMEEYTTEEFITEKDNKIICNKCGKNICRVE